MIRQRRDRFFLTATALLLAGIGAAACDPADGLHAGWGEPARSQLKAAIAAPTRTPANVARDRYRHPYETLAYFGVRPSDTVVEIWPGGGWYTEILAPYLRSGGGEYWVGTMDGRPGGLDRLIAARPDLYGAIRFTEFPNFSRGAAPLPAGGADVVLTFRNVHNWRMGYQRQGRDYSREAFGQIYHMLRPGGTLGVVDHRLPESASDERERTSGYIKTSTVIRLAEAAGFRLVGQSEVNANPADTADWPNGVWTLPPTLRLGEQDRARYLAIGESDRMTLKFVRPRP